MGIWRMRLSVSARQIVIGVVGTRPLGGNLAREERATLALAHRLAARLIEIGDGAPVDVERLGGSVSKVVVEADRSLDPILLSAIRAEFPNGAMRPDGSVL
jgi:hypothetical protein